MFSHDTDLSKMFESFPTKHIRSSECSKSTVLQTETDKFFNDHFCMDRYKNDCFYFTCSQKYCIR